MKRSIVMLVVAALLAACAESSMGPESARSHPDRVTIPPLTAQSVVTSASAGLSVLPVEDAVERVVAVLPDSPHRQSVLAALADLREAVEAGDGCAIRTTRRSAEQLLRDFGKQLDDEHEADLDVVGLAIESVEQTGKGKC